MIMTDVKEAIDKWGTSPRTVKEWLDRFPEEDRRVVRDAITKVPSKVLFPIISELDENPYPFTRKTLNDIARQLRGEEQ